MVLRNEKGNVSMESSNRANALVSLGTKLAVNIEFSGEKILVDQPGEYEHKGIDVFAKEAVDNNFKGEINLLRVTADDVRVAFLADDSEIKQEDISSVLDIDILIVSEAMLAKLDKNVSAFDPKKVLVIADKQKEADLMEVIKKFYSTATIEVIKQLKVKADDVSSDIVSQVQIFILK